MGSKVDAKRDKRLVQEYIQHLENRVEVGQDVADMNFKAVMDLYVMCQKVFNSNSSEEAKSWWGQKLTTFNNLIDFTDKLMLEINKVNSYNEYNFSLNQELSKKNKELKEENERLNKLLEEKYL